ncbi:MAG TPA: hypothetical protein VNG33_10070 [Polyangiaceae bacterium]|nr:hypothetical protein [Polyangiaceae bacterium]
MRDFDFCELSVEQEEYLVELLCTRGACTLDLFARELDELCRENAIAYLSPEQSSAGSTAKEAVSKP